MICNCSRVMELAGKTVRPRGRNWQVGKTGDPSGLYNTYRIPFGKSLRVTGQLGKGVEKPQTFWWIFRGVENLPVYLGNIQLPPKARLRLQVHNDVTLDPLQMVEIAHSASAGALYQVTLAVASKNCNFLEAMLRAICQWRERSALSLVGNRRLFPGNLLL